MRFPFSLLGLTLVASACCQRPICNFEVAPPQVCPGGTATIKWSTGSDSATITPIGAVAGSGEQAQTVNATTTFQLTGTYERTTQTQGRTVAVTDGSGNVSTVSRPLDPCDASPSFTVTLGDPPEGDAVVAATVFNGGDPVTVSHGGITLPLGAGERSTGFAATPFKGVWQFQIPTRVVPANCGNPSFNPNTGGPLNALLVTINGACRR